MAINGTVKLLPIKKPQGVDGATKILFNKRELTVNTVDFETPEKVAVMMAVPGEIAMIIPLFPEALLTIAMVESEELHTAWVVKSSDVPSVKVPVAVNWIIVPLGVDGF